ncbi:MAG: arginyl-tRNA synthetase [Hyphomicrobiales bacterium]|jgi:arginyl-tRNA synthetase|nr:arginyl-tRNA synthetase [Hyphomicrobiales bacterium]
MLISKLSSDVQSCFDAAGYPRAAALVTSSRRPEFGQFQTNSAMAIAKLYGQPPRKIAEAVSRKLAELGYLRDIAIEGPGFINFSVTDGYLREQFRGQLSDSRHGVPAPTFGSTKTVVLDYGGPNVAKAMHVGHLRSAIIGDTLRRISTFLGNKTIADVHLGDWGLPMGMVLSEIRRRYPDLPHFTGPANVDQSVPVGLTIDELNELYPAAAARCSSDEASLLEARRLTKRLQNGDPGLRSLWQYIVDISVASARQEFARLNVEFDLWRGESHVHRRLEKLISEVEASGLAERDLGALVIHLGRPEDDHEIPPLIIEKSDGAVMYAGTDLATIAERVAELHPDLILYVVDQRQRVHFEQVFRAAEKLNLIHDGRPACEHIGFGTVNGPDGKPLKTRAGGVLKLSDLINQATDAARARLHEVGFSARGGEEFEVAARQIGVATIRFADLANNRTSDYIFNLEKFSAAEGRTGPYLCYSAVRARAIQDKADRRDMSLEVPVAPSSDVERNLIVLLLSFGDAVLNSFNKRLPSILCEHLFDVAQAFNTFYHQIRVLNEPDADRRQSLLAIISGVDRQIRLGLSLLGIDAPQKM